MAQADFPLPDDLPVPLDDGAAEGMVGTTLPAVSLPATDGSTIELSELPAGRTILYVYPMTGRPGVALPDGWDEIPGARGCTPESCGFRDHFVDLLEAGAVAVHGLSSQDTEYQREVAERLELPFALLSDAGLALAAPAPDGLGLPTFETSGMTLYRRLTLVVSVGRVEHVFYPVFPPDGHAVEVLGWLRTHPA